MPVDDNGTFDALKAKLANLLTNMQEDMDFIGGIIAEEIIITTLAGIGEGDQPFAPYSPFYQSVLDQLGGKPRQNVDLRGIIDDNPTKVSRTKRDRGQGRTGIVTGWQGTFELKTRPQYGLRDPNSELSIDNITVESEADGSCKVVYTPKRSDHMIRHQTGASNAPAPGWWPKPTISLPARPWFSADKAAVKAAAIEAVKTVLNARLQWFNDHGSGGTPPHVTARVTR